MHWKAFNSRVNADAEAYNLAYETYREMHYQKFQISTGKKKIIAQRHLKYHREKTIPLNLQAI